MAGFVGICCGALAVFKSQIDDAVKSNVYSENTLIKDLCADNNLILKRSCVKFIELEKMEAHRDDVHVWIDGEVYNQEELRVSSGEFFAETLLNCYLTDSLEDLLKKVDGLYVAL